MRPEQAIASLERQIAAHGQKVTLRRYTGQGDPRPKTDIADIDAFVRVAKADDLVGDIKQAVDVVILSPTKIGAFLPLKKNDKIIIDGRERNIELPKPKKLGDVLVRIELLVSG